MYIFCFVVPTVAYRKRPSFVIILFVTCSVFITFVVMGSIKGPVFIFLFLNLLTPELSSLSLSVFHSLALQIRITVPHILKANLELLYMVYKAEEGGDGWEGRLYIRFIYVLFVITQFPARVDRARQTKQGCLLP